MLSTWDRHLDGRRDLLTLQCGRRPAKEGSREQLGARERASDAGELAERAIGLRELAYEWCVEFESWRQGWWQVRDYIGGGAHQVRALLRCELADLHLCYQLSSRSRTDT